MPDLETRLRVVVRDETAQAFAQIDDRIKRLQHSTERSGHETGEVFRDITKEWVGMIAGFVGAEKVVDFFKKSAEAGAEFSNALTNIKLHGATTRAEAEKIGRAMDAISGKVHQSTEKMIGGFDRLRIESGLSMNEIIAMMPTIGAAATVTGAEVDKWASLMALTMKNLNIPFNEAAAVADKIAFAANRGGLQIDQLADAMPELTAQWGQLGYSGSEGLVRMLGLLESMRASIGGPEGTSKAIMALEKLMTRSSGLMQQARTESARKGTDAVQEYMKLINQYYRDMEHGYGVLSQIIGDKQARTVLNLSANWKSVEGNMDAVRTAGGYVGDSMKVVNENLKVQTEDVGIAYNNLLTSVSELMNIKGTPGFLENTKNALLQIKWLVDYFNSQAKGKSVEDLKRELESQKAGGAPFLIQEETRKRLEKAEAEQKERSGVPLAPLPSLGEIFLQKGAVAKAEQDIVNARQEISRLERLAAPKNRLESFFSAPPPSQEKMAAAQEALSKAQETLEAAKKRYEELISRTEATSPQLEVVPGMTPGPITPEQLLEHARRQGAPEMQEGGVVSRPTVAVIGESGPEAIIPLSRTMTHEAPRRDAVAEGIQAAGAIGLKIGEKIEDALMAGPKLMRDIVEGRLDAGSPEAIQRAFEVASTRGVFKAPIAGPAKSALETLLEKHLVHGAESASKARDPGDVAAERTQAETNDRLAELNSLLRELIITQEGGEGAGAGGGGGGLGGGGAGGGGVGGGGDGGGGGGGAGGGPGGGSGPTFRPGIRPGRRGGGGGGQGGDPNLTGNAFLESQRAPFGKELQDDPKLKLRLAAIASLEQEGDPAAVIESLMNRQKYSGRTLAEGIAGGPRSFYRPARIAGKVEKRMAELEREPARLAALNAATAAVLSGSNLLKGATDQGSPGDPNAAWEGGRVVRQGEVYNDWAGGPGGHEGARRWREDQQAQVAKAAATEAATTAPPGAMLAATEQPPEAFIVHHTGGRGTIEDLRTTLEQRHLGVEYAMDREGNITQIGGPGSSHMKSGWGAGAGLSNRNTVGMEVIAKSDRDVTAAQIAAATRFIQKNYPRTPVYGHGEVNPGHKEADEGMSIVRNIRAMRQAAAAAAGTQASLRPPPPAQKEPRDDGWDQVREDEREEADPHRKRMDKLKDEHDALREHMERPIKLNVEAPKLPSQLAQDYRRPSAREALNREVRDARWLNHSDTIQAA